MDGWMDPYQRVYGSRRSYSNLEIHLMKQNSNDLLLYVVSLRPPHQWWVVALLLLSSYMTVISFSSFSERQHLSVVSVDGSGLNFHSLMNCGLIFDLISTHPQLHGLLLYPPTHRNGG